MYWGEGWEDPATKQHVNRALRVVSNDSSVPMEELTDFFDWLEFEEAGGVGKVKGNEGYEASSLQTWVPRNDSVQHGHFMLYLMDDVVSNTSLDRPMEELFFSISLDAGVHPQYAAEGVTNLNCTLRLFLIEGNAADEDLGRTLPGGAALGKDSDEQLVLKAGQSIVYQRTLSNALGTFVEGKLTLILTLILTRTRTLSLTPILTRTRTLILTRTRTLTRQAHRAAVGGADRGGQPHRHVGLP